jgi:hypothetical protein
MKRMNVADEFARLQRESQRVVELLGDLLTEPDVAKADPRGSRQLALIVQRHVIPYSRTS